MKKAIVLIIIILTIFHISINAEDFPEGVSEGVEETRHELTCYLNDGSLEDYFDNNTNISDIQFDHYGELKYLDVQILLDNDDIIERDLGFNSYLFALTVDKEGKVLVLINNEYGEYLPVDIGGYAKGYIQAESVMKRIDDNYEVKLLSPFMFHYLMIYEFAGNTYVIPFDQTREGIKEEYLKVKRLNELPTLKEYCIELKNEINRRKKEIDQIKEDTGINDILYSGTLEVNIRPKVKNIKQSLLFVTTGLVFCIGIVILIKHRVKRNRQLS